MTCRHSANDPACSANQRTYTETLDPPTPDSKRYEVVDVKRVGPHLVLKVKYPNCFACAYEGNKVMVFINVTEGDVLKWRSIDPHFRADQSTDPTRAPSPAARFPASDAGWADALAYAASLGRSRK